MDSVKKLITKKYFFVIFFFSLLVILAFALHITITDDINRGKPKDDLPRTEATVTNFPDSYTVEENGKAVQMYSNIAIEVHIGEKEVQNTFLNGTVPKPAAGELTYGSTIKVKYLPEDHTNFFFADDPQTHYRVFLYVVYSILILGCIFATIFSSKVAEHMAQKKIVAENMRRVQEQHDAETEAMSGGYKGIDGKADPNAVDIFANDTTDYNAVYEQNKNLTDAEYSAEGTYSSFGSSMDSHYDPFTPYTGQDEAQDDTDTVRSPGAPSESPYSADESPLSLNGSDNGMSNASMDVPDAPDVPYTGYGMPNASMDAPYDPNAPYTGYGMPNVSMDAPYDPNSPYTGM